MIRFHPVPAGIRFAAVLTLGLCAAAAQATTTLMGHDLSQPARPYEWRSVPATDIKWTDTYDIRKAVGVTLDSGTSYHFNSFTAMLAMVTSDSPEYLQTEQVRAAIFADGGGRPGALLADLGVIDLHPLQPIQSPFAAQRITWDATAPVLLQGGNTYWFGLNDTTQYSEFGIPLAHWTILESGGSTLPVGAETLAGYRISADGGLNWNASTFYNAMQIQVTPVPEPHSVALMLAGLGLVGAAVARHYRARPR
jgi:hypothetical protein